MRQQSVVQVTGTPPDALGGALARAFFAEPNFTYLLPDEVGRGAALPWFFSFVLRLGVRFGEVYTTTDQAGGAIWIAPGRAVTPGGSLRAGILALPFRFGWGGFKRSMRLGEAVEGVRNEVVPEPHWYLMALGVEPSRQGEGIGAALLWPALSRASETGLPCYLETFHEKNLPFYGRYGFRVVVERQVPGGGPKFWGMLRAPRG